LSPRESSTHPTLATEVTTVSRAGANPADPRFGISASHAHTHVVVNPELGFTWVQGFALRTACEHGGCGGGGEGAPLTARWAASPLRDGSALLADSCLAGLAWAARLITGQTVGGLEASGGAGSAVPAVAGSAHGSVRAAGTLPGRSRVHRDVARPDTNGPAPHRPRSTPGPGRSGSGGGVRRRFHLTSGPGAPASGSLTAPLFASIVGRYRVSPLHVVRGRRIASDASALSNLSTLAATGDRRRSTQRRARTCEIERRFP